MSASLMRDEHGNPTGISGTLRDISDRKKAEKEIMDLLVNFNAFFETLTDMVIVSTPEGRILFYNSAVERKLGYDREELSGMHLLDLNPEDKRDEAKEILDAMLRGERDSCPLPVVAKDGTTIPVETRVWKGHWNGKDCVFSIIKDLSAEQEAKQRFELLFHNNPALMAVSSIPDRRFVDVNDTFLRVLGYSKDEVIGKTSAELGIFPNPEDLAAITEQILESGRIVDRQLQIRSKDGTLLYGLFSGDMIETPGRKEFLTVMIDITAQKEAELDLISYVREAALRLRNPVNIVIQFLDDAINQIREGAIDGEVDKEQIVTLLTVQLNNLRCTMNNIAELDRSIAEKRREIPEEFRKFLKR